VANTNNEIRSPLLVMRQQEVFWNGVSVVWGCPVSNFRSRMYCVAGLVIIGWKVLLGNTLLSRTAEVTWRLQYESDGHAVLSRLEESRYES
jgi:hypothetical protein